MWYEIVTVSKIYRNIFIPVKALIKAKEAACLYHLLASQLLRCFASWLAWSLLHGCQVSGGAPNCLVVQLLGSVDLLVLFFWFVIQSVPKCFLSNHWKFHKVIYNTDIQNFIKKKQPTKWINCLFWLALLYGTLF